MPSTWLLSSLSILGATSPLSYAIARAIMFSERSLLLTSSLPISSTYMYPEPSLPFSRAARCFIVPGNVDTADFKSLGLE